MERFKELKQELLRKAKRAGACKEQYTRAYNVQTLEQLMEVCRDNFVWACNYAVLDVDIITQYHDEFALGHIYANEDTSEGYLLCCNASVKACGNTRVEAHYNASVIAYDNTRVEAHYNASVIAYDNARVKAYHNASVTAYANVSVVAYNNVSIAAYSNASVEAHDNAYITSFSDKNVVILSGNAIYRIREDSTIRYATQK